MALPLLAIAIPTRNRSGYLKDSLGALVTQILELPNGPSRVTLHVSDNTSTDNTPDVVREQQMRMPSLTYHRHPENVGASRNVNSCVRQAKAPYCWVVGDDELICPGAVKHVVEVLSAPEPPDLLLCFDTGYESRLARPSRFKSYRDYATECARTHPHALVEHTLVTSNIFRTVLFDLKVAEDTLATDYSHMYAMLTGMRREGRGVYVTDQPVITVRQRRAPAVDGVWPTDLEASWLEYLRWQREQFDVVELRPQDAIEHVRQALWKKLSRHPIRYVRNNLHALKDPKAWRWFLKRLLFHSRR